MEKNFRKNRPRPPQDKDDKQLVFDKTIGKRLEQYNGLSYHLAKQFNSTAISYEEKRQAALIGIAKGLQTFRQRRGTSELSWVYLKGAYAIEDAIRDEVERRIKRPTHNLGVFFSLQDSVDDGAEGNIINREEFQAKKKLLDKVKRLIRKLPERERTIVREIAFHGKRQREVAKKLGITQSWCSRLYNRTLQNMREEILKTPCIGEVMQ